MNGSFVTGAGGLLLTKSINSIPRNALFYQADGPYSGCNLSSGYLMQKQTRILNQSSRTSTSHHCMTTADHRLAASCEQYNHILTNTRQAREVVLNEQTLIHLEPHKRLKASTPCIIRHLHLIDEQVSHNQLQSFSGSQLPPKRAFQISLKGPRSWNE